MNREQLENKRNKGLTKMNPLSPVLQTHRKTQGKIKSVIEIKKATKSEIEDHKLHEIVTTGNGCWFHYKILESGHDIPTVDGFTFGTRKRIEEYIEAIIQRRKKSVNVLPVSKRIGNGKIMKTTCIPGHV